jgi:hypothetical protein
MNVKNLLAMVFSVILLTMVGCGVSPVADSSDVAVDNPSAATTVTTSSALISAVGSASAGTTITISGTITMSTTLKCSKSGTSSSKITLKGGALKFSGQSVSDSNRGVLVSGSYWVFSGITISNAGDNGMCITGKYNTVTSCKFYSNADSGLQIYSGGANNAVTSCTSYYNYDKANGGENADGFAAKKACGSGNVFTGCYSYNNSDDGYDLYQGDGVVKFYTCTAIKNGYISSGSTTSDGDGNGFKLGGEGDNLAHYLKDCVAKNNLACGFTKNNNTGAITYVNCTSSGNGKSDNR